MYIFVCEMIKRMGIVYIGVVACIVVVLGLVGYMYEKLVLKGRRIRVKLERQGIKGPKTSSVLLGNIPEIKQLKAQFNKPTALPSATISHDWTSKFFPHVKLWHQLYGRIFIYSAGSMQILSITDSNIIKEISLNTSIDLGKPGYLTRERGPLLGHGVVSSSGSFWTYQRKLISPEFFPDKTKGMFGMMVEATVSMLNTWEDTIKNNGGIAEISVDNDLRNLSQDIIAKAAFGSSYSKGKHIFAKLRTLQAILSKTPIGIPGSRHVPIKINRQINRLEKEINQMILKVVEERIKAKRETDFLQKILEGAKYTHQQDATLKINTKKLIVDNCKTIYFAGHETTSSTAMWCLMLLAINPDWQDRARAEVSSVVQNGVPTADDLRSLKVLTMILHETLRLYPVAFFASRTAQEESTLNGIKVPKGVDIQVTIPLLHHDPELWGEDVLEFKPERFANGIGGACKAPHAYMPFGFGARVCLGQHFAMVEIKIVLSIILSKFTFSLSPSYRHSPTLTMINEPEHGVPLILRSVKSSS